MVNSPDTASNAKIASELRGQPTRRASEECLLRKAVAVALKVCRSEGKDRVDLARELTIVTGERITKRNLDDWASPSKMDLRFPAWLIRYFCIVTRDNGVALAVVPEHLREQIEVATGLTKAPQVIDTISDGLAKLAAELRRGLSDPKGNAKRRR